ncbi:hypothetical protein GCM10007147_25640 [Nocardiopsis kunsanensis]|uniref:Helix-turn-helix domain-containing protein n=1 Tax=Nocardiopsis kunsanensis TaxID=141693 RepID=A0A918XE40_9ACTN|nr:helix-turn-helix domain-containing protein [Nocardiopsis kunsanensis]GHD27001.1 hypothetical protein GCM10007147_25640 [Nocardiopsis kunsanensis]
MSERHQGRKHDRASSQRRGTGHYGPKTSGSHSAHLELLTPAEVAELLKVPESWLRKSVTARQIPCTFLGKHLRFSSADVEEIIRAGHRNPVTGPARSTRRRPE